MNNLIGITSLSLISFIILFFSLRFPEIFKIMLVALLLRIIFLLFGHFVGPLPGGGEDEVKFELMAWLISQNGFLNLIDSYGIVEPRFISSKFISFLISIPYSLFGESKLMAKSMSLLFGMATVFLAWIVSKKIWGNIIAVKVTWFVALFPPLILYSTLIMRETYITFFLLVTLHSIIDWVKTDKFKFLTLALFGFILIMLFHGAMIIGGFVFLTGVFIFYIKKLFKNLKIKKIDAKILIVIFVYIGLIGLYISNQIKFPYLGNFEKLTNKNIQLERINISNRGLASYPEWTKVNSIGELFFKVPIRGVYFIYSPFPWDIKSPTHLIGMFDAFVYIYLSFLIFKNRRVILKDPALMMILLILITYILLFGLGVGNFGTGLRHRSKIIILMLLLAAPYLKGISLLHKFKKLVKF
ncbi:ArnT family glycosyltransferase [Candidatus Pelagibacter bacterium nBUS_49]|uniref:ArnT family glycosyltransferase n=1 Tax=Candidatus Pelagibacter bacterium nBUS_49 TaxID=3374196 RepID=UPI003EC0344A